MALTPEEARAIDRAAAKIEFKAPACRPRSSRLAGADKSEKSKTHAKAQTRKSGLEVSALGFGCMGYFG